MNTENNILIAEFLGLQTTSNETYPLLYKFSNSDEWFAVDELKFDTDWNWLMEVVEKIKSLGYNIKIESFEHTRTTIGSLCVVDNETMIDSVYSACMQVVISNKKFGSLK